jgi:hypothetical protein
MRLPKFLDAAEHATTAPQRNTLQNVSLIIRLGRHLRNPGVSSTHFPAKNFPTGSFWSRKF